MFPAIQHAKTWPEGKHNAQAANLQGFFLHLEVQVSAFRSRFTQVLIQQIIHYLRKVRYLMGT